MMEHNEDRRCAVEVGTLDVAQIEHVAVLASQLGDTETEGMCDSALSGQLSADRVTSAVREDARYHDWMERGRLWGWEIR
jgi:hypothetical protein